MIIPQSKVDLTGPVNEFAHKVKEWDLRTPGMDISVRHLLARQLPDWVKQAGPGAAAAAAAAATAAAAAPAASAASGKPPLPAGAAAAQQQQQAQQAGAGGALKRQLSELSVAGAASSGGAAPAAAAKRQNTGAAVRQISSEEEAQPVSRTTSDLQLTSLKEGQPEVQNCRLPLLPAYLASSLACCPLLVQPLHAVQALAWLQSVAHLACHRVACCVCLMPFAILYFLAARLAASVKDYGKGATGPPVEQGRSRSGHCFSCVQGTASTLADTADQQAASAEAGLAAVGDSSVADWTVLEEPNQLDTGGAAAAAGAAGAAGAASQRPAAVGKVNVR
jgi:hypothetical protein